MGRKTLISFNLRKYVENATTRSDDWRWKEIKTQTEKKKFIIVKNDFLKNFLKTIRKNVLAICISY